MYMEIIKLQKHDIKQALDLAWNVFLEFDGPDYSKEGIEEFKKFLSYPSMKEKFEKGEIVFWGCKVNSVLTGVIATRGISHICMLFVIKEFHRKGIATRLFEAVKENCKNKSNIIEITVNSSPYALEAYRRLGFIDTDHEQIVDGIRFIPMSYLLK
ncbi:GNAT family N-acetyltransferase [Domibacillus robiginosus]|uniref:GNAT family N-acetyltransferase n=1 Tax=Domibacillus robiginosus TaxID=1071054 RepID=UPI00067AD9A4|nr:GNAT family N-acetyltransferase [Domibacillus robiginosus]